VDAPPRPAGRRAGRHGRCGVSTRLTTRTSGRRASTGDVIVSLQTGGTKEKYLRAVCRTLGEVEETVKAMLATPDAYLIGKPKRTTWTKKQKVKELEEAPVSDAVDDIVDEALAVTT
jgi:hypothetical protein